MRSGTRSRLQCETDGVIGMVSPVDDRGSEALRILLSAGAKGPGPKSEALEALALRPVWLATWEPRAEGFRTLINGEGEEALAVFSTQAELNSAAKQFDWLEKDGTVATHRAIGGDILRHAWTREYAFVVIDIGTAHSLEYGRDELKSILREMDSTGPFRTSRPPPPPSPDKPVQARGAQLVSCARRADLDAVQYGTRSSREDRAPERAANTAASHCIRQRASDPATRCAEAKRRGAQNRRSTDDAEQELTPRTQAREQAARCRRRRGGGGFGAARRRGNLWCGERRPDGRTAVPADHPVDDRHFEKHKGGRLGASIEL